MLIIHKTLKKERTNILPHDMVLHAKGINKGLMYEFYGILMKDTCNIFIDSKDIVKYKYVGKVFENSYDNVITLLFSNNANKMYEYFHNLLIDKRESVDIRLSSRYRKTLYSGNYGLECSQNPFYKEVYYVL